LKAAATENGGKADIAAEKKGKSVAEKRRWADERTYAWLHTSEDRIAILNEPLPAPKR
jgi:hypothetical protein